MRWDSIGVARSRVCGGVGKMRVAVATNKS